MAKKSAAGSGTIRKKTVTKNEKSTPTGKPDTLLVGIQAPANKSNDLLLANPEGSQPKTKSSNNIL